MENLNIIDERFDLSDVTRDGLRLLLSTAKDEWGKYTKCREEAKECARQLVETKNNLNQIGHTPKDAIIKLVIVIPLLVIFAIFVPILNPEVPIPLVIIGFFILIVIFIITAVNGVSRRKIAQNNIDEYAIRLPILQKEEENAKSELNAILLIPDRYCYEYALITMLQYIDDKRASNWERCTDLYEEESHRSKIEMQAEKQTELARQTRNAARMAAAGAWASAAGIWRINSKI